MSRASTVRSAVELYLVVPGGPSLPVPAELSYDAGDPWAVRVAFHTGDSSDSGQSSHASHTGDASQPDGSIEWLFSRQLLSDGLRGTAGEGDVRIWPSTSRGAAVVELAMSSPSGAALFEVDRAALVAFLEHTYAVVPTGHEMDRIDLDAALGRLLVPRG